MDPDVHLHLDGAWTAAQAGRPSQSGYRSEGGAEAIEGYLSTKFITQAGV